MARIRSAVARPRHRALSNMGGPENAHRCPRRARVAAPPSASWRLLELLGRFLDGVGFVGSWLTFANYRLMLSVLSAASNRAANSDWSALTRATYVHSFGR